MPITVRSPRSLRAAAPALRALVRAALAGEKRRSGELGIVLTDDAEVRALNHRWRGLDRATDVLSFGYDEAGDGAGSGPVRGDIVISLQRLEEQARRYRVSRGHELARLVVHGALHLAGLDHRRPGERSHMRAREEGVLERSARTVRALERILDRPAAMPS
jgi:probable rRNA maturation factor